LSVGPDDHRCYRIVFLLNVNALTLAGCTTLLSLWAILQGLIFLMLILGAMQHGSSATRHAQAVQRYTPFHSATCSVLLQCCCM